MLYHFWKNNFNLFSKVLKKKSLSLTTITKVQEKSCTVPILLVILKQNRNVLWIASSSSQCTCFLRSTVSHLFKRKIYPTTLSMWHAINLIKNVHCLYVLKKFQIVLFDIKGKLFLILLAFLSLSSSTKTKRTLTWWMRPNVRLCVSSYI